MLFITTRNKFDTYTVHRANQSDRGPDGGLYLPFHLPVLEKEAIHALAEQTFGQRLANILNSLFGTQLTGWDVELAAGKNPINLVSIGRRILMAETWHNHNLDFAQLEGRLAARLYGYTEATGKATSWVGISIRIATLFGIYGDLLAKGILAPDMTFDVAVAAGDFASPMAVWYARQMGLPVGSIICGDEDSAAWDLIHRGQVRTDGGLPENLERLVSGALGVEENVRFCQVCQDKKLYTLQGEALEALQKGMYAAVTSRERLMALIPSVYRTSGYVMGPKTAMAYGALQDYQARTGAKHLALVLSDSSPLRDSKLVTEAMGITQRELEKRLGE